MTWHISDDGKVVDGKMVVFLRPRPGSDAGGDSDSDGEDDSDGEGSDPAAGDSSAGDSSAAADAGAGDGSKDSKTAGQSKDAAAAESGPIRNLRWSTSAAADGDQVDMAADVDPGVAVLFTVERRVGSGAWTSVGSVNAQVDGGSAKATTRLEHPGDMADVHFRFTARAL